MSSTSSAAPFGWRPMKKRWQKSGASTITTESGEFQRKYWMRKPSGVLNPTCGRGWSEAYSSRKTSSSIRRALLAS